ncbi:AraC family transcriptional regulator [Comamonas humi]
MTSSASPHRFHRHPAAPWAELRDSSPSPHCFRLHMHAEYSIGIVDAGRTVFHHAQGPQPLEAGGVVLIEPGAWHACNPEPGAPWSYRMLFVDAAWLQARLGVAALRFPQRALADADITRQVDRLCRPIDGPAAAQRLALGLEQLMARCAQPAAAPLQDDGTGLQTALQRLHAQPDAGLTVQSLAQECGMSATRFIRRFKAATGMTPGSYRLNLRINGARRLLASGAPLSDAAYAMGFADQAHLQRAFKAHHALTPGCYARGGPA